MATPAPRAKRYRQFPREWQAPPMASTAWRQWPSRRASKQPERTADRPDLVCRESLHIEKPPGPALDAASCKQRQKRRHKPTVDVCHVDADEDDDDNDNDSPETDWATCSTCGLLLQELKRWTSIACLY